MIINRIPHRYLRCCVQIGAAVLITVFAWPVAAADEHDPRDSALPDHVPETMRNIIAFEKSGAMPSRLSTPEQKCIGWPEQKYIIEASKPPNRGPLV